MVKFYIHLGLHKTGTKFFQHKVFPNLDPECFLYNPPRITQLACDLMKAFDEDVEFVINAIHKEKERLKKKYSNKKIVISREILSGDLFSFYSWSEKSVERLHAAFFDADIIYSKRYQVDWIVSCYRESVHEHHYQSIKKFVGIDKPNPEFVNNDYKNLDIHKYEDQLKAKFKASQLHLLYYENFRKDKLAEVDKIAEIIGAENIDIKKDNDQRPNRGYSAFSINVSIFRYNFFKALGLKRWFVHRPIVFFGSKGIPAGFQNLSVLPKEKYWHDGFLRDNEEVRSDNYPNLTFREKIKLEFSWRSIIKKRVDKLFYWDWDLLGKHRKELEDYFKKENKKKMPQNAPSVYFE